MISIIEILYNIRGSMLKTNFFKNKIFVITMSLLMLLSCGFIFTACGNKNYSVNMNIDGQYLYLDMFGFGDISFKKDDLYNSGLTLYGYDVYDYSDLTVLINGKEDSEIFTKQESSGTYTSQIRGVEIQVGTFSFGKINEDVIITISGVKEKDVSFAFMRADDERLGDKQSVLTPDEQITFDNNYNTYIENFSTILEEKDYKYFDTYYEDEDIANSTSNGYTSVDWLFKDNENIIMYENEEDKITLYQPYEFKYKASQFFNKYLLTYYAYITPDGIFTNNSDGSPMENLPSGTKEYKYQKYVFTNGIVNKSNYYDSFAIFEILSNKKYGYYDGIEIKNYDYNFENYGENEGILSNYGKTIEKKYMPLNKENITAEELRRQSNYVFELYEKNLFVFNFLNMKVKEKDIVISNINVQLSDELNDGYFNNDGTNLNSIGAVNTKSTFYIHTLPNKIDGVSGVDFSNAEIYVNGTKLEGALGGFTYVPANTETGMEEYFECYINANVVEVDCYSKESLLDRDLLINSNNNEKFEITIKNINFDNATGLSKVKATDTTSVNIPNITSSIDYDMGSKIVYSWVEGNTIYAYAQTSDELNLNNLEVVFNPSGNLDKTKTPKVSIKKGSNIKEIDVMAQINKGLADSSALQNWVNELDQINDNRTIGWTEDGYQLTITFWQSEVDIQYISTISVKTQFDETYTDWWEFTCKLS